MEILIAFSLDNWNEKRKQDHMEQKSRRRFTTTKIKPLLKAAKE